MRYAKLENGWPRYAPRRMRVGSSIVYNPTDAQLLAEGYLPVVETDAPETDEQHYAAPHWTEDGNKIVQSWEIAQAPESDEATETDYINALSSVGVSV